MRATVALTLALAALLAAAAGAAAAPPDDLSADPLDRGALLALPSVYRVEMTMHVEALRTADGRRVSLPPEGRELEERGTAFAAAPGGWLVTAAHVAAPTPATVARLAYQAKLAVAGRDHGDAAAAEWVREEGARPVGARLTSLAVTQADAGAGAPASQTYTPSRLIRSRRADLALMRIKAGGAPALALDESASIGTPVESIGFGTAGAFSEPPRGALEPAIRRGELGRTGTLEENTPDQRQAILLTIPLQAGDSGAPVVDGSGNVRGVAVIRTEDGGIAERATEVRQLLESVRVTPGAGASAQLFRGAMTSYWDLDLAAAERGFAATQRAFPDHTLAAREGLRARELARSDFHVVGERRRQGFLLALGALAVVAALACGAGLARTGRRGRGSLDAPTPRGQG